MHCVLEKGLMVGNAEVSGEHKVDRFPHYADEMTPIEFKC